MDFGRQLLLLLWKNWILQRRRICVSIFEIILPTFFALLIVLIRLISEARDISYPTTYARRDVNVGVIGHMGGNAIIGYYPETSETSLVMQTLLARLLDHSTEIYSVNCSIQGFPKEDLAMGFAASNPESVGYVVAFKGVSSSSATLPKNIEVAIRPYSYSSGWATEDTFPIFQSNTPRNWMFPDYLHDGFNFLQVLVGEALAKYWVQKDGGDPSKIHFQAYVQCMPYPPYFDDVMIPVLQGYLPFLLVLSFILSVIINTKNLVYEKERKLKVKECLLVLQPLFAHRD